jgi:hypothetical protein
MCRASGCLLAVFSLPARCPHAASALSALRKLFVNDCRHRVDIDNDNGRETAMHIRHALVIALVALTALVSACGESRGYSRGIFHGMVIDKTEEEVVSKMGKPESIEKIGDDGVRYIYRKKTFDPDNLNQIDDRTVIDFEKKAGKSIVVDVSFG